MPSYRQFFFTREDGSIDELERWNWAHNEHIDRLNNKFDDIWYFQGEVPETARTKVSHHMRSFLGKIGKRKAYAMFFENSGVRL
jgi:hypothetical protein